MGHCFTSSGIGPKAFKGLVEGFIQTQLLHWSTHCFCVNQTFCCKHLWLFYHTRMIHPEHSADTRMKYLSTVTKSVASLPLRVLKSIPQHFQKQLHSSSVSHKLQLAVTHHLDPLRLRCNDTQCFRYHVTKGRSPDRPQ